MTPPRADWLTGTDAASARTRRKWAVTGTSGLLTGIGHGFVQFAVSALLKPIAADLGMSRAGVSAAISLGRLVQGLTSLAAGHSVDRWGSRPVVVAGTMVMALGLVLTARVSGPLGLCLAWGVVVSAGTSFAFTVAMDRTVVAHADTGRGVALAIRFTVVALVTTVQIPLIVWLVESFGWRTACFAWGGVVLATLPLPLLLFESGGLGRGEAGAAGAMTLGAAARTRDFWILAFAYMSIAGSVSGVSVHSMPMLTDRAWSVAAAGAITGGLVLLTIPARLATGVMSDRLGPERLPRLLGAVLAVESLCFLADAVLHTGGSLLLMLVAKGIATGVPTVMIVVISVARFGKASLGAIQGAFMLLQVPGTMAGPVLAGLAYDRLGSYQLAVGLFGAFLLASALLLQLADTRAR